MTRGEGLETRLMAKAWIACLVVAMAVGSAPSTPAEAQENVSGRWKVTYSGSSGGGARPVAELMLKVDGEKVTGTWSSPTSKSPDFPVTGSFKGGALSLDSAGGESRPGWLTAQVKGDKMTGKMPTRSGTVLEFTAARIK